MLTGNNGVDIIKFFKRFIRIVVTFSVTVIKDLIGERFNCVVYSLKSTVIIVVKIVFNFFLNEVMVRRNHFQSFIGGVCIPFALKVFHNLGCGLIETLICQNASLFFIVTINYHDITPNSNL